MLSRIADALYWLNRYMERSDSLMRAVRIQYMLSFDCAGEYDHSWQDLIKLFAGTEYSPTSIPNYEALTLLITDTKNINTNRLLITKARENARGVQDYITKEVWEQINQQYHIVSHPQLPDKLKENDCLDTIELLTTSNTMFYGTADSTMPRGLGWDFMNIGKFIERCIITIDMMEVYLKKINYDILVSKDFLYWRNLLLNLAGYELYLKSYTRGNHTHNMLNHVLFNTEFPRSVFYSLGRIKRYLGLIIENTEMPDSEQLIKQFGRIYSRVEYADIETLQDTGIQKFLADLKTDMYNFANQLSKIYFSYN